MDAELTGLGNMASSGFGDFHRDKRMRAGSISGRLRTASDLEEWGWIDKSQKGIIKDLIISGHQGIQSALEKFEKGDPKELEAMIQKGVFTRKHSIDLLDGLDLDFLNVEANSGGLSSFEGDFSFDNHFEDDLNMDMNMDLFRGDDGVAGLENHHDNLTERSDRDWFMRRMSIGSDFARGRSGTTDWHLQGQGILLHDSDRIAQDILNNDWATNGLDAIGGVVDMSAYETVAASLQNSADSKNSTPPQVLKINKRQLSKSSSGTGSAPAVSSSSKPKANSGSNKSNSANIKTEAGPLADSKVKSVSPVLAEPNDSQIKEAPVAVTDAPPFPPLLPYNNIAPRPIVNSSFDQPPVPDSQTPPTTFVSTIAPSGNLVASTTAAVGNTAGTTTEDGVVRPQAGYIGAYSPESRRERVERFLEKRNRRVWTKKVKYDVRKNFADSRLRVKGRFVKKEDEELMRELLSI